MRIIASSLGDVYSGPVYELNTAVEKLAPSSIFIIADQNTASLCVPRLGSLLNKAQIITIAAGEQHKNLASCDLIWSSLVDQGADRTSLIINVGGGMICDLGGFAASCYQRGIRFVHVPTTVLSMADAAFGGKTGIDFHGFKNYIGLFRVPTLIWVDEEFLKTLPLIEKISGLSEIVKHAIIGSEELWEMITGIHSIEEIHWNTIFEKNLPVKLKIAEADPSEKGIRKVLNFGHTVGHAIESYFLTQGHTISHGNCIATGMLVEARISNTVGLLNDQDFEAIVRLIYRLLDPVMDSLPTFEALSRLIMGDKKKQHGNIGYSLPDRIGSCGWDIPVEDKALELSYLWLTQVKDI